jgi:hypothetical protein
VRPGSRRLEGVSGGHVRKGEARTTERKEGKQDASSPWNGSARKEVKYKECQKAKRKEGYGGMPGSNNKLETNGNG